MKQFLMMIADDDGYTNVYLIQAKDSREAIVKYLKDNQGKYWDTLSKEEQEEYIRHFEEDEDEYIHVFTEFNFNEEDVLEYSNF